MQAVCNASPVITLAKSGLIHVLDDLFERVVLTKAVVEEILAGGKEYPGARAISDKAWLEEVSLNPPASRFAVINLGAGEAETVEWCLRQPDFIAILDDKAARRTAVALGCRCAGTLRVIYEACRKQILPSFAEAVQSLESAGLYCDQKVIDRLLKS